MASAGSARSKCGRWVDVWSHPVVESLLGHADRGAFHIARLYAYSVAIQKSTRKQTWNLFPGANIGVFFREIVLGKTAKLLT